MPDQSPRYDLLDRPILIQPASLNFLRHKCTYES